MKKLLFVFSISISSMLLISCNMNKKEKSEDQQNEISAQTQASNPEGEVPYTLAKNYFVNNTYKESGVIKVNTQEEFDKIFGAATTMGKEGMPTKIDFSNSFVIAVIGKESNKKPEIRINSLTQKEGSICVNYSLTDNEEVSYTIQPAEILVVDRKYEGEVEAEKV